MQSLGLKAAAAQLFAPKQRAERRNFQVNLNQLSIIGFLGKDVETKSLPNGTPVVKFSVATKRSWKDDNDEWQERTQWHQVVGFGDGFAKLAERLVKGTHVFVQGELTTREYDRTIKVPNGKKVIEHADEAARCRTQGRHDPHPGPFVKWRTRSGRTANR